LPWHEQHPLPKAVQDNLRVDKLLGTKDDQMNQNHCENGQPQSESTMLTMTYTSFDDLPDWLHLTSVNTSVSPPGEVPMGKAAEQLVLVALVALGSSASCLCSNQVLQVAMRPD
jgi:hypothetical protein